MQKGAEDGEEKRVDKMEKRFLLLRFTEHQTTIFIAVHGTFYCFAIELINVQWMKLKKQSEIAAPSATPATMAHD